MRTLTVCVGLLLLFPASIFSQILTSSPHRGIAQVPIGDEVYAYLRHLSVRGLLSDYSEAVLPITEFDVVRWLDNIDLTKLSTAEKELRTKYLRTYKREPYEAVTMFSADSAESFFFSGIPTDHDKYLYRWRSDSSISDIQVHGIGSLEYRNRMKPTDGNAVLGVIGGRFTGTLSGHVGFFMETTNGQDFGDSSIALEDPVIGKNKNFAVFSNHNFFDLTSAELTYNNDWFTAKIAREAIAIGGSYQGNNIIISPNVQMPDFVTLQAHVGAVRYQATVASLLGDARFSERPDTSVTYSFGPGAYIDPKYIAIHDLTFMIGSVEFGFTDLTIFSRRFDLAYANPFSFLKSVEHSLNDRDNGLLAAHARWKIADGIEIRGQGLVDDIVASRIGTGYWGNKFAWQIGGMWSAPFGLNDFDIAFEHTRVEPFTYSHFNTQNAFTTSGQLLGAAIGPNALSYWGMIRWAPSAKLSLEATITLVERGENIYDSTGALIFNAGADYEISITDEAPKEVTVLIGRRVNIATIQATARYELWRGLTFFAQFLTRSVDYPTGIPIAPIEKPYGLLTLGAKAIF